MIVETPLVCFLVEMPEDVDVLASWIDETKR
jgi:hypothetical protein